MNRDSETTEQYPVYFKCIDEMYDFSIGDVLCIRHDNTLWNVSGHNVRYDSNRLKTILWPLHNAKITRYVSKREATVLQEGRK